MYNWQARRVDHLSNNLAPVEIFTVDLKLIVRHPACWVKNMATPVLGSRVVSFDLPQEPPQLCPRVLGSPGHVLRDVEG